MDRNSTIIPVNSDAPVLENSATGSENQLNWNKKDSIFAVITLICAYFFAEFSVFGGFKSGFTVSYFMIFILTVSYLRKSEYQLKPFPVFCGFASLCASVVFSIYSDPVVNTLLFILVIVLFGIFIGFTYGGKNAQDNPIICSLKYVFCVSCRYLDRPFLAFKNRNCDKSKKAYSMQIFIGFILSVPILMIVLPLLISSDAAFEGLMSSFSVNVQLIILKLIMSIFLAVFLFSLLFAVKNKLPKEKNNFITHDMKKLPGPIATTVFSVLSISYCIYLFSQLAYFFSAFSGILPNDFEFSISEYARRGFFELCAVCGINLVLVFLAVLFVERNANGNIPKGIKLTSTFVLVFSAIFTATALSKMFMYIGFYGLTRLRMLTTLFMFAIAIALISFIVFIYIPKFKILKFLITAFTIFGISVAFCDMDSMICRYNINRYHAGTLESFDVAHLGTLSDSAVPYIIELLIDEDDNIRADAKNALTVQAGRLFVLKDNQLEERNHNQNFSYNYSRNRAIKLIKENSDKIEMEN